MNKSRRLRRIGHVARMGEDRSAFKILTGTPTAKRPLGRPRETWVEHIRMDFKEMGVNSRIGMIWFRVEIIGELL
jgi:hypothetical protein